MRARETLGSGARGTPSRHLLKLSGVETGGQGGILQGTLMGPPSHGHRLLS